MNADTARSRSKEWDARVEATSGGELYVPRGTLAICSGGCELAFTNKE